MKVLMHHSQQAARSFVRGLEIRLNTSHFKFLSIRSDPGFVNPIRSDPGFVDAGKKVYSYKISMFKINGKIVSTFRSPFLNKLSDFANVFKAFMGCGYLVMPFAFKQSGLIVSKLYSLSTEVTKPI
jgi:hypothetical protein